MGLNERIALIKKIEEIRGSTVICFLTSLRQNVPSIIAEDSVRAFFDHLLLCPSRPVAKLDIFLCSNGGSGTVPWRLVSLFREFRECSQRDEKTWEDQQLRLTIFAVVLRFPATNRGGEPLFRSSLLDSGFSFLAHS